MAYAKSRLTYKKEVYYILCIAAVLTILLFSFLGPQGYRDLQKARLELQEQRVRVDQLERANGERLKTINALKSNREALERYAREKGYGREGEIIQQLPQKPK
jgi:cell division protein FtsB